MNNEWKMPEWMIKWVHVIDTEHSVPSVEAVESSMNAGRWVNTCTDACVRAKVELMETLHKKGII